MMRISVLLLQCALISAFAAEPDTTHSQPAALDHQASMIIVAGAPGDKEYGEVFDQGAALWKDAAIKGGVRPILLGLETNNAASDRERLQKTLSMEPKSGSAELWIVLLGHGTFDGRDARFNLRGPDITAAELGAWLQPFTRPLAIINASSSSGPFLPVLSGTNRVVITATKSGFEQNYSRFGSYLAGAIADPHADLDQDGQTSLLEAFLRAAYETSEFYRKEGRIATEHALIDDNGDAAGTPPDWFRGIRAVKKAKDGAPPDGLRAHQMHLVRSGPELALTPEVRAKRDAIEMEIDRLRDQKPQLAEDEYYRRLEQLMLRLAAVYGE